MPRLADCWSRYHSVVSTLENLTALAPYSRNGVELEYNTWRVAVIDSTVDTEPALSTEPMLALHLVGGFVAWTETETVTAGVVVIGSPEWIVIRSGKHLVE